MERLKGKRILIGKEPGQGRLLVAVEGSGKSAAVGAAGSVPSCVSRCRPAEGVAHVRLDIDGEGGMTLTNLKPQNVTFVNGSEIASKRVSLSDRVELGKEKFPVSVKLLTDVAAKLIPDENEGKFDISHLEAVWTDFQERKKQIQAKQKKINLVRSGCGVFTVCTVPCISLFGPYAYVLTGIGLIGNLYSFIGLKNDNTADLVEQLTEEFQDSYVCPNPACGKFLGNISYKLLKKQYSMHCPYCKSEFIEK